MSTKNETPVAEATQETQKLSVLDRIKKLLKLDDAGRVEKFFTRETKKMLNNIDTLEMNKQAKAFELKTTLYQIDSDLEDANQAVEDAFDAIKPENVVNNDVMDSFSYQYWANIDQAERRVKTLEERRKQTVEAAAEEARLKDEKIAKYKYRISRLGVSTK